MPNMEVKNILQELAKVDAANFIDVLPFNDHQVGAVDITGVSPVWEMHPDTDEFFYVVEGTLEIELLTDPQPEIYRANAGETMVVPKGYWHKPGAPEGAKFIYLTPGQSLHSNKEDPRV